jgi:hypothetical protein
MWYNLSVSWSVIMLISTFFPLCYVASLKEGHTEVYETVLALSSFLISALSDSDTLTKKHSNQMFSPCLKVDRGFCQFFQEKCGMCLRSTPSSQFLQSKKIRKSLAFKHSIDATRTFSLEISVVSLKWGKYTTFRRGRWEIVHIQHFGR